MYWIYLLVVIIAEFTLAYFNNIIETYSMFNIVGLHMHIIWVVFIMPTYLSIVNINFLNKKLVKPATALLNTTLLMGLRILCYLIHSKIEFGEFIQIGFPEGLYIAEFFIPLGIIIIEFIIYLLIKYMISKKQKQ